LDRLPFYGYGNGRKCAKLAHTHVEPTHADCFDADRGASGIGEVGMLPDGDFVAVVVATSGTFATFPPTTYNAGAAGCLSFSFGQQALSNGIHQLIEGTYFADNVIDFG